MSQATELAAAKFADGFNCAQATLYAFAESLSISNDLALKMACGFGAGMGGMGKVCGAISAGVCALGIKYGRDEQCDPSATSETFQKVGELFRQFSEKHDTVCCNNLIEGCDLSTDEGRKQFQEKELKAKVCTPCITTAVEVIESLL